MTVSAAGIEIDKRGHALVDVLCDCGTKKRVTASNLRRPVKYNSSCGCIKGEWRIIDIPVGTRRGKLVTIGEPYMIDGKPRSRVDIRCDCGVTKTVYTDVFLNYSSSCGCLKIERCRQLGFAKQGLIREQSTRWNPNGLHKTTIYRNELFIKQQGKCAWPWCKEERALEQSGRNVQVDHNNRCCKSKNRRSEVCGRCIRGLVHRECNFEIRFADRMFDANPRLLPDDIKEYLARGVPKTDD